MIAEANRGATHYLEGECHIWHGRILLARGQLDDAFNQSQRALDLARSSDDRQNLDPALAFGSRMLLATGDVARAAQLIDELFATLPGGLLKPDLGIDLPLCLVELGHPTEALEGVLASRWLEAAQAFISGDKRQAAEVHAAIGSRPDEAYARLQAARQLMAADKAVEASTELALALAFCRQVQARAHLADVEKLLETMLSSN